MSCKEDKQIVFTYSPANSQYRLGKISFLKQILSVKDQKCPRHFRIKVNQVSWNGLSRALQLQNFLPTTEKHL